MATNDHVPHDVPTPGSAEAHELGCCCSVRRNNHGLRSPLAAGTTLGGSAGGWLMARDCFVHVTSAYRGALVG